jgi:hypothetical protein
MSPSTLCYYHRDSSSFTAPPTGHTTSPRHRASPGKKKVVLLFPMAKFSRFLDLPAELRYNVYYYAMLPETLHVSLTGTKDARYTESFDLTTGKITKSPSRSLRNIMDRDSRKISFEHIFESQNKLMIKPFSISTFSVSRQIYGELQHLFYQKSTWYFDNLDSLVYSLIFLPSRVRMKIRHLAFSLKPIESPGHRFPRLKRGNRDQRWTFSSVSRLLESNLRLNTISIQYSKLGGCMEAGTNRELRQLSEGQKAACAVTEFVWPGIVTSLLYGNAEMTEDLVESARTICGAGNVEWRSCGQDRYRTPLAELVICRRLEPSAG